MAAALAIGLMSGTSLDGIDAALIAIEGSAEQPEVETLATLAVPYPAGLRERLLPVAEGEAVSVGAISALHRDVAIAFAEAAQQVIEAAGLSGAAIASIGSHGQTVHHQPPTGSAPGHTLQLGEGAWIAERTGVTTVSNFRSRDMAAGGQGAPLVPLVDYLLLRHPERARCIQNLGGIGNVTYLPAGATPKQVLAFDTGPANLLIDAVAQQLTGRPFDRDGALVAAGQVDSRLLAGWLADPYFALPPPKSTGRESFGYARAGQLLAEAAHLSPADLLATVSELTVESIARAYGDWLPTAPAEVFLGGGGVRNRYLVRRLRERLAPATVASTAEVGIDSDFKEAIAFAVLAWLRCSNRPGNLPSVSGAARAVLLGDVHPGR